MGWTVFAGLDKVDWARMAHAYGPATDVPDMIRGLVSPDPAVRERALDGMEGAVHHQLDVYDCTVAAMPFLLEAATTPGLPGRAEVLGLVASIGSAGRSQHAAEATRKLAAAGPELLNLLSDADREVRQAVCAALPGCHDDLAQVVSAVLSRLPIEPDTEVQAALIKAAGALRKHTRSNEIDAALKATAASTQSARVRVAALTESVRSGPAQVPPGVVAALAAAAEAAYAEQPPPPRPDPVSAETLRGMLHQRQLSEGYARPAPHLDDLVRDVSWAFGDRVAERRAFLAAQLRARNWAQRYHALFPAQTLLFGWRGDHSELVSLIGDQLTDSHPKLRLQAATRLEIFGELSAPAADALADCIESAPRTGEYSLAGSLAWTAPHRSGAKVSPAIRALARIGDRRTVPVLRWLLEQDPLPDYFDSLVAGLGSKAAELAPLIRDRLRNLGTDHDRARTALCQALAEIGPDAADAAPDVLAALESADPELAASVLIKIGAGTEAIPLLRSLLENANTAVKAATALWKLDGDTETALPVFLRALNENEFTASAAATGIRHLGPAAVAAIPALRALLDRDDEYGWLHQNAATALWRITGDPGPAVAVLQSVWQLGRHRWPHVARDLVELGPAAAPAAPLLRAALASPRRYLVEEIAESDDGLGNSIDIAGDEAFQRDCRTVLTTVASDPDARA
ncbi:HEAT repeat domain-containing protein [Amycolatopsis sp. WGS_07]|uniref:HEAT repeat domain-containing protein n=1 Tax=Amycolatopsis sp. WGS_07 TaxID=3076764 RepID=UPI003873B036